MRKSTQSGKPRMGFEPACAWNSPAPSLPATMTEQRAHAGRTMRRRREVAQILQQLRADDRLPNRILYLESPQLKWDVRELQASVSPTPFAATPWPLRRPYRNLARCKLHRHHRADVRSSTGSERAAPRRGYFFFLAATLRLAGAFFFAAVFAFVAFFTILPS